MQLSFTRAEYLAAEHYSDMAELSRMDAEFNEACQERLSEFEEQGMTESEAEAALKAELRTEGLDR